MLSSLASLVLLLCTGAQAQNISQRICGTGPLTESLNSLHQALYDGRNHSLYARKAAKSQELVVETFFHFVSTEAQASSYDNSLLAEIIANQSGVLNAAYAPANITFDIQPYTFTINDTWATDSADADMKAALHRGSYSTLNVYFQTSLSTVPAGSLSNSPATTILGYCSLPESVTYQACRSCAPIAYPPDEYTSDGCNILASTMPNGAEDGYNEGKTTVHEVGHWFGLYHPFEGNTCDPSSTGDFIADTPQESTSTNGCPAGKDSCLSDPGLDPIHNYMDYSADACYTSFTPDQMIRMNSVYQSMRQQY
ncbi:hypothetical protein MMC12_002491 [Toensbergia leucococca]|nr:hypothetical protein [Toensbergia leucococca]